MIELPLVVALIALEAWKTSQSPLSVNRVVNSSVIGLKIIVEPFSNPKTSRNASFNCM